MFQNFFEAAVNCRAFCAFWFRKWACNVGFLFCTGKGNVNKASEFSIFLSGVFFCLNFIKIIWICSWKVCRYSVFFAIVDRFCFSFASWISHAAVHKNYRKFKSLTFVDCHDFYGICLLHRIADFFYVKFRIFCKRGFFFYLELCQLVDKKWKSFAAFVCLSCKFKKQIILFCVKGNIFIPCSFKAVAILIP